MVFTLIYAPDKNVMLSIELAQGNKLKFEFMKTITIIVIWAISFAFSALFANSLNIVFWLSFVSFCICSLYMAKNKERMLRDLEE